MVSAIVSDHIISLSNPIIQFLAALYFYSNTVWAVFTIHVLFNKQLVAESIFRLGIGKCSREQYPRAARSCYISKEGTLYALGASTLITINNYCLVGSRS